MLRLTDKERENAVREERNKWRIFRMQQVREQARIEAGRIRGAVSNTKKDMVNKLEKKLFESWQEGKENEIQRLKQEYDGCFEAFGKAHNQAEEQPDAAEMLAEAMVVNKQKAARRGCEAVRWQKEQVAEKEKDRNTLNERKRFALKKEKIRANRIAQLPTPIAFVKENVKVSEPPPKVQLYEHGTLTTTSYVPENFVIEKEIVSTKPSAHQLAEVQQEELEVAIEVEVKEGESNAKKQEKRGKAALHKENLRKQYQTLMDQLDEAHRDHHLSAFLRGSDCTELFETQESRLKAAAAFQRNMEAVAERILQDKHLPNEEISTVLAEGSDLKEITDDSKLKDMSKSHDLKQQGLNNLQDDLRKHRLLVNQLINDLHGSPRERNTHLVDESEIGVSPETESGEVVSHPDSSHKSSFDSEDTPGIQSEIDEVHHKLDVDKANGSAVSKRGTSRRVPSPNRPVIDRRGYDMTDDIHLKETLPAHRLGERRIYKSSSEDREEVSVGASTEITDHRSSTEITDHRSGIQDIGKMSTQPSSDTGMDTMSSGDINVRIHVSSDSNGSEYTLPSPIDYIEAKGGSRREPNERHPEHVPHLGDNSSTDYASLPSLVLPFGGYEPTYLQNLEKIQQQREYIQRLLDGKGHTQPSAKKSPVIYRQEISPLDGTGKRPLSRKSKFEVKKRALLQQYMRKLLDIRKEDVMQLTASTVEGSGLTVNSLNSLLESVSKNDEETLFSSLANLPRSSSSSSAIYPDIDQIPTKLSTSPEMIAGHRLTSDDSSVHVYDPRVYGNTNVEVSSSSSDCVIPVKSRPFLPVSESLSPQTESDSSGVVFVPVRGPLSVREPLILDPDSSGHPLGVHDLPSTLPRTPSSTEVSVSLGAPSSEVSFENANMQREQKMLHDLQMIQRLKQQLFQRKDAALREYKALERLEGNPEVMMGTSIAFQLRMGTQRVSPKKAGRESHTANPGQSLRQTHSSTGTPFHSLVPSQRHHSDTDLCTLSDESMDQFVLLKPEESHCSSFAASSTMDNSNDLRRSDANIDSRRAEVSAQSEVLRRSSHSASESEVLDKSKASTISSRGFKKSEFEGKDGKENRDMSLASQISKPSNVNHRTVSSSKEIDPPSELPKEKSVDHSVSSIQQDRESGSQSSLGSSRSRHNSAESVTSIPDMAEILHRFGVNWAQSMIRRMDEKEQHSSSGS